MANTLAATSRQTRELLGYVASRATRSLQTTLHPLTPYSTDWRFIMATPVFWEGNIGSAPEHRSFPTATILRGSCCVST